MHVTLAGGKSIAATDEHPFRSSEGWRDAILLKKGTKLLLMGIGEGDDDSAGIATMEGVWIEVKTVRVYNLEFEYLHTWAHRPRRNPPARPWPNVRMEPIQFGRESVSRVAFRWLVVASFAIPILCMVADATVFAHLVPMELKDVMARQTAEELNNPSWGVVASMVGALAVLLAVPFLIYGLLRFRPWAPKLAIWLSAASYALMPFYSATVYSGLGSTALSLGSMLWGMVVLLPYASTEVRDYFWPAKQESEDHGLRSRH